MAGDVLWTKLRSSWRGLSIEHRKRALGLCFIFVVALIWVLASFLVQDLESEGLNPFLLTYIANSLFIIYLPLYYLAVRLTARKRNARSSEMQETPISAGHQVMADTERTELIVDHPVDVRESVSTSWRHSHWPAMLDKQVLAAAAVVAPLWFAAQYTFNVSLSETTVTSNTILASTSSLFTYALACLLFLEVFLVSKLAFIVLCMAGTALVTIADARQADSGKTNSVGGDLLVLLSGLCYAAYTIAIRKMLQDDNSLTMMLFFGCVGFLNAACLAPVLIILRVGGFVQTAGLTLRIIGLTICKGLFDNVLSDYLWARAVLLIGPTVATVGLSMQVPFAVVLDAIFKQPAWLSSASSAALTFVGAALVLTGFFGINVASAKVEEHAPA
ncbi:Solute carrier family 35 member F5 [Coccomyxa sp. Obi]|nr:Solute carrier family 35 member F5 [Coccomyxa sp. Obi]